MKKVNIIFLLLLFLFAFGLQGTSECVECEEHWLNMWTDKSDYFPKETIKLNVRISPFIKTSFVLRVYKIEEGGERLFTEMEKEFTKKYENIEINLTLPSGEYKLVGTTPYTKNQIRWIEVSEIGFISKYEYENGVSVIVLNKTTGEPIQGAEVSAYIPSYEYEYGRVKKGEKIASWITDGNGFVKLDVNKTAVIEAKFRGEITSEQVYKYYDWEEYKIYAYSDRPIYRPGQTVHFRGIIFKVENGYKVFSGNVTLEVYNPEYKLLIEKEVMAEEGIIYTDFKLNDDVALGLYTVNINAKKEGYERWMGRYNFQVQEYHKPEFEVSLSSERKWFKVGDEIKIDVDAQYYFGKPVVNAEVQYEAYKGYTYIPCYRWNCRYYDSYYGIYPYPYSYKEKKIASGTVYTDEEGRAVIKFLSPDFKEDYDVLLEVKARDESERTVEETFQTKVSRGFVIKISTNWYVEVGKENKVKIEVKTPDNEPIATSAYVKIIRREWKEEYKNVSVKSEVFKTNEQGIAYISFTPEEAGEYIINVIVEYEGTTIEQSAYVWVYGYDRIWYRFENMEVSTDKERYSDGEVMKIFISSPIPDADLWVSIENGRIFKLSRYKLNGTFLPLEFKITKEFPSSFSIHAVGVKNGTLFVAQKIVKVERNTSRLNVEVGTEKSEYEPGDETLIKVFLKDENNTPTSGIISLAVVDKSIFALAPSQIPDIYEFFYREPFRYKTITTYSWGYGYPWILAQAEIRGGYVYSMTLVKEKDEVGAPKNDFSLLATIEVRKEFPDTALWKPFVIVGKNGEEIPFKLPQSLTTWNMSAVASTSKAQVGMGSKEITVSKELLVRLETPVFLTQNDKLKIAGIVHNYQEPQEVIVFLNVSGVKLLEENEKKIWVAKNGNVKVEYDILVDGCCEANFTIYAIGRKTDAMQLTIPILPHGAEKINVFSGAAEDEKITYTVPDVNVSVSSAKLTLTPSIASTALEGLEYLAGYPYGCVEQTMSGFLPDVVLYKTLDELDIKIEDKIRKQLPDMIEKGLQRLYGYQNSDGSWGWFRDNEGDARMSAYVMYGLTLAKKAGVVVDEQVYERGLRRLEEFLDTLEEPDDLAYLSYVYSITDGRYNLSSALDKLKDKWEGKKLSDYAFVLYVLTLYEVDREKADSLIDELISKGECTPKFCKWKGIDYKFNDVETTSHALLALLKGKRMDEAVKAVQWLVSKRRATGAWYSTRDSAMALIGISAYIKDSKELYPNYEAVVLLDGKEIKRFKVTSASMEKVKIELPSNGTHEVNIRKSGDGKLYYLLSVNWYATEEPILRNTSGEMDIKREYNTTDISVGEELLVNLTLTPYTLEYLVIEDYLPSGVEVVKDSIKTPYWINRYEIRDNRIVFFISRLYYWSDWRDEEHQISYKLRGIFPGTYHILPAKIFQMYEPDVFASCDENRLNIYDKIRIQLFVEEIEANKSKLTFYIQTKEEIENGILKIRLTDVNGNVKDEEVPINFINGTGEAEVETNMLAMVEYEFAGKGISEKGEKIFAPIKKIEKREEEKPESAIIVIGIIVFGICAIILGILTMLEKKRS